MTSMPLCTFLRTTFSRTSARSVVVLLAAAFVATGLAACGSGGTEGASTGPTAGSGEAPTASSGGSPASSVDPCQWYTAEEMGALVGFTVTMTKEETPQDFGTECLYDSQEKFTSVTVRPTTAATYDEFKAVSGSAGLGGKQIAFPGVGDAAFHNGSPDSDNASVAFNAKKGTSGIRVELATAGNGLTIDKSIAITSTIAKKALG